MSEELVNEETLQPTGEKLQKVLARLGLASRREIEQWIKNGRISINGEVASLGARVDALDQITVDGRPLKREEVSQTVRRVLIYNKPEGEVCTRNDPEGRPTIFDRLPKPKSGRWINIGRLDINTSGLLLFTTDGELANRMMHPSFEMDREYAVRVRGEVTDEMLENLKNGVVLEDGPAKFTDVQAAPEGDGLNRWYHCVVMEGRNREVRRLWESQGVVVSRLKRVRFGPVFLNAEIRMGRWREMAQAELDILSKEVGLEPVALPEGITKDKEQQERLQRKIAKPISTKRNNQRFKARDERDDEFSREKRNERRPARNDREDGQRGERRRDDERTDRRPSRDNERANDRRPSRDNERANDRRPIRDNERTSDRRPSRDNERSNDRRSNRDGERNERTDRRPARGGDNAHRSERRNDKDSRRPNSRNEQGSRENTRGKTDAQPRRVLRSESEADVKPNRSPRKPR